MTNEETHQVRYGDLPADNQQELVFTLRCGCGTYRSFVYSANLSRLVQRMDTGMGIETACHECKRKMSISLFWSNDRPGYTNRDPVSSYTGHVMEVIDDVPLMKMEEEDVNERR